MELQFTIDGTFERFDFVHCTVAGWTGRDQAAIQHHIDELAVLGVTPPSKVPLYYRVSSSLLTQAPNIEAVGGATSGEAEPFIVFRQGQLYLGLASDHTDRDAEKHSVALSKQLCMKPVANTLWRFDEVADHLEAIEMRSWIRENDGDNWLLYQEGALAAIRSLTDLIAGSGLTEAVTGEKAAGMLCGTLSTEDGIRPSKSFRLELYDPVLNRRVSHRYGIIELPVVA